MAEELKAEPVAEAVTSETIELPAALTAKLPQIHEGRIIVRNLPFDLKEQHIKSPFEKFGKIVSVNVPLNNTNNLNKGFAFTYTHTQPIPQQYVCQFVEFESKADAVKAIEALNGKQFKGRAVALEFSLPKTRYETKIQHILENTKQTRADIVVPKILRVEREERKKVEDDKKAKYEQVKLQKDKEFKAKKAQQKIEEAAIENKTLFVRNISYDTQQADFQEFMERFGPLKYAVLCKAKEFQSTTADDLQHSHKGTGFVQFKDPKSADQLIELSQQIEERLDKECKEQRIKSKKEGTGAATTKGLSGVIQAELELNGRRLVVMEAMKKGETLKVDDKKKQDKRNLGQKREGLLNFEDWIHKEPRPTEKTIQQRQRLLDEKDKALAKSTNLFVSKKRVTLRGLPKRDFLEKELKELMLVVIDEWLKNLGEAQQTKSQKKKLLKQVKVLRDDQKTDAAGEKLANGVTIRL